MLFRIMAVILVAAVIFVMKSRHDRIAFRRRMEQQLARQWGMDTREEYSDRIMHHIQYYHERVKTKNAIDEITWNDLELDLIFRQMNHTRTSAGEEYLYHILHTPEFSEEVLLERERVIQCYQEHPAERTELELALLDIGKTDKISVYEFLHKTESLAAVSKWPHVLAAVLMTAAIITVCVSSATGILLLFAVMVMNAYFYYREKARLVRDLALFEFVLGIVRQCDALSSIKLPECEPYLKRLKELSDCFASFCRFHFLVSGGSSMSGNLFDSLFDYVRILFHVDLIKLSTMIRELQRYERELLEIYDIIGSLDSMLAVASYRERMKVYTIPVLHKAVNRTDARYLKLARVYHPFVTDPVRNDVEAGKSILLTGSNASGKSTFLKAVAVNALFAQTIHTVLAERYEACFFRLYSSMALRDDLLSQESYFIVEIKSLKRIFSAVSQEGAPVLCFIDEILRGTNTAERVAASSVLLTELSESGALCFAATHDIELTYLLEEHFDNYHFAERLCEGDILFDYRLKAGRADSRNAIRLLSAIGFDRALTDRAQERVEHFLQQGD